jgi:hydroxymethylpyrimidine/phosphomethylpyrimidine kinase
MLLVRDNMNEVLITLLAPKYHIIAPNIAKATTVLQVVNFARELRFFRVALEGDALHTLKNR